MVEYINVYKAFDAPVLAGVNLAVESGETMAIVGHSGTGKSVLLKTTIGLIVPDFGDVKLDGESVFHSDRRTVERLRRKVGYVFQNAALFDSMTVFENVSQGIPEDELNDMRFREVLRRVAESLEMVNLDLYDTPWSLILIYSALNLPFNQQRVQSAANIVRDPDFFDG